MTHANGSALLEWREYRYFPYEKEFAEAEVRSVLGTEPIEADGGLLVPAGRAVPDRVRRLTYFGRVLLPDGSTSVPDQAVLETGVLNGRRQATRYSAHGIHEYKGKFNPQVVRAIGNILGLETGSRILDPFCGSGTTLLESAHAGWHSLGIDRNPMAVRIAKAKLRAFKIATGPLPNYVEKLTRSLGGFVEELSHDQAVPKRALDLLLGSGWTDQIPSFDYLSRWFPLPVLGQAWLVLRTVRELELSTDDSNIFEVILSDLLREASLQEPADLRIRRRRDPQANYPLLGPFLEMLEQRVDTIIRAREGVPHTDTTHHAFVGDNRTREAYACSDESFDALITSPPYATALPYIDTQRLSLVLLGDVGSKEISGLERSLTGAREISAGNRRELEARIRARDSRMPDSVNALCTTLLEAASGPENGFRRKNKPALVYRYFDDMRRFFEAVRPVLKSASTAALVVGHNRTTLGGTEFLIDTPALLGDVASSVGFELVNSRTMDTYPRYDLHQDNSIDSETLIEVRAEP
ncbi:DNA methyltransferase [Gaopeijia maritima]|uniref:TRM11 family SAM-dependent methyltransferase n=1 Tax=Gaopeijia maritima TaxID=3119007 RepID=UPI0032499F3C